jgi:NADH dehydrogenase FAD-containing subunit
MKTVVIIGGGFAGTDIAKRLEVFFNIILIDTKSYFEFTPGILNTVVNSSHADKLRVNHHYSLNKTRLIIGKVSRFDENTVFVGKEQIRFDYLVICSGAEYKSKFKGNNMFFAKSTNDFINASKKLSKSKDVLIIGGGFVAVELAGELREKNVTIVSSADRLLSRLSFKTSDYVQKHLLNQEVRLLLGERVVQNKGNSYFTDKNTEIKADIVFNCTGSSPNSSFMDKKMLDEKGFVKVNKFLQVDGMTNVFSCGDVTNIKEEKTAQNAKEQAKIVAKNIKLVERNKKLCAYKTKERVMLISLGKKKGILIYKNFPTIIPKAKPTPASKPALTTPGKRSLFDASLFSL